MTCKKRIYPQWFIDELANKDDKKKALDNTLKGDDIVTFKCPRGHFYSKKVCLRIKRNGDPICGCLKCVYEDNKLKRLVKYDFPDWFINELVEDSEKELAKSGKLPLNKIVKIKCPTCGFIYDRRVKFEINVFTKDRIRVCPKCMLKTKNYNHKKHDLPYPQWFIDEIIDPVLKQKAIDGTLTAKNKVVFRCSKGHEFERTVANYITITTMKRRTECPYCKKEKRDLTLASKRIYPDWLINEMVQEEDKEKAINGTLKSTDYVLFKCGTCSALFSSRIGDRIKCSTQEKRYGCPSCGEYIRHIKSNETISQYRFYPQWFIDELVNEEDKEEAIKGTLKSSSKVDFKCSNGHIYKQLISNHISMSTQEQKSGCPICFSRRSKTEIEIEEYIISLGFSTEHKKIKSNFSSFYYVEIDVYIPEKKIGIEYNGSFWHKTLPKDDYNKERLFHQNKYLACKQLGIRLISIFEPDWAYRKNKVKQYLKDLLLPIENKLHARKCEIKQIDYHTANNMYDEYHLLGKTTVQAISYGLFYNTELLSCMSFQKGRYKENNKPIWTLTRFVTKSGYSIVGGASKLLSQFEKDFKPDLILSYSDNDYFSGGLYSNLGFENKGCTNSPRYFWWLNNQELKRETCQLKHLSQQYPELYNESMNQTEYQNKEDFIMLSLGACKVYRSGHTKWLKSFI